MSDPRPLSRRVLADQVKERLLEDILSGRHAPDSRIVETAVAKELGTSQAPVREALRGLEALGVVEITPFRGARVRRPSRRDIIEAYAVRTSLEVLAARLAVPRIVKADKALAFAPGPVAQRLRLRAGHVGLEAAEPDKAWSRPVLPLESELQSRVRHGLDLAEPHVYSLAKTGVRKPLEKRVINESQRLVKQNRYLTSV